MNWKKTLSILSIGLMISSIFFCSRAVDYTFANPNQPQRWWDEVSVNCSSPTQDGEFTISVQHNGTMNGRRYFGNWVFRIPTTAGMTAADKAAAMREKINKSSGCPLKGGGEGSYVNITAKNGKLHKWNFKSTDGQSLEGLATEYDEGEFSFLGTMEYDGKVKANVDDHRVSVFTNGKTLQQIHQEIVDKLTAQGVNVFLDPYGLAFYVDDIVDRAGIDSDDDNIHIMGGFPDDVTEPYGIIVGMLDDIVAEPGSIITASFDIVNFMYETDMYKVVVADTEGWNIDPFYIEVTLEPGEHISLDFDITVPPAAFNTLNLINITATSMTLPWITSSGLVMIFVDNPPDIPTIEGPPSGKAGEDYIYQFSSMDPEGDEIYYYIEWGDGQIEDWIGPYNPGDIIDVIHSWDEQGTYLIKAKAKDVFDMESEWGTLEVEMPVNYQISQQSTIPLFFQMLQRLLNIR